MVLLSTIFQIFRGIPLALVIYCLVQLQETLQNLFGKHNEVYGKMEQKQNHSQQIKSKLADKQQSQKNINELKSNLLCLKQKDEIKFILEEIQKLEISIKSICQEYKRCYGFQQLMLNKIDQDRQNFYSTNFKQYSQIMNQLQKQNKIKRLAQQLEPQDAQLNQQKKNQFNDSNDTQNKRLICRISELTVSLAESEEKNIKLQSLNSQILKFKTKQCQRLKKQNKKIRNDLDYQFQKRVIMEQNYTTFIAELLKEKLMTDNQNLDNNLKLAELMNQKIIQKYLKNVIEWKLTQSNKTIEQLENQLAIKQQRIKNSNKLREHLHDQNLKLQDKHFQQIKNLTKQLQVVSKRQYIQKKTAASKQNKQQTGQLGGQINKMRQQLNNKIKQNEQLKLMISSNSKVIQLQNPQKDFISKNQKVQEQNQQLKCLNQQLAKKITLMEINYKKKIEQNQKQSEKKFERYKKQYQNNFDPINKQIDENYREVYKSKQEFIAKENKLNKRKEQLQKRQRTYQKEIQEKDQIIKKLSNDFLLLSTNYSLLSKSISESANQQLMDDVSEEYKIEK